LIILPTPPKGGLNLTVTNLRADRFTGGSSVKKKIRDLDFAICDSGQNYARFQPSIDTAEIFPPAWASGTFPTSHRMSFDFDCITKPKPKNQLHEKN
jgi:hypothetical protein